MKRLSTIAATLFAAGLMSVLPAVAADTSTTTTTTKRKETKESRAH